jgi:competence ComEA-like helix-hairpin-helix protein
VPTANERKALWFLAFVALSGSGVRLWRARIPQSTATESAALERQILRVDSVRETRHKPRSVASPASAESSAAAPGTDSGADGAPVDLDRAAVEEIESLPGIGPALAKRIAANRDSIGAFGGIEALCDVRGVGPTLAERLRPLVTFTGPRRLVSAGCNEASKKPRKSHVARTRKTR